MEEKPDLLDWQTGLAQAALGDWIEPVLFTKDSVCTDAGQDYYFAILPTRLGFETAALMCRNLGGSLHFPKVQT